MVTEIHLIRHGETEDADSRRYKGHIDVPLSDIGKEQIKRLSKYMSTAVSGCEAVYCSDLSRALKSAEIIAEPFRLEPVIMEFLRERNFGVWEGMTFDEIKGKYNDAFNAWAENPLEFGPVGGESTIEVRDRIMPAFNVIADKHRGQKIAIVSHGGVIRIILCELLGIPLENIFRIEQDFAALNVINLWDYPVIRHINYVV